VSPRTILITGATGAIGSELARAYAAPERFLVLHGRDTGRLQALARECESRGAEVESRALDVRDTGALTAWIESVMLRSPVDLAIVNAGAINALRTGGEGETWPDIERVLEVNLRAAFATVSALLPSMQRRGSGQIALVSSLLAWFGMPVAPTYSASKAALKAYGEALRGPLARQGIRISVVMPGFVKSAMSDELSIPKPFMLSPEDAARMIIRGLARNKARISFPFPLNLGAWLLSALPASVSQALFALLGYRK
jgi:short-subunit dehydrogenase